MDPQQVPAVAEVPEQSKMARIESGSVDIGREDQDTATYGYDEDVR